MSQYKGEESLRKAIKDFVEASFELRIKLLKEVNTFCDENPTATTYSFENDLGNMDENTLFHAWVIDRMNGIPTLSHQKGYNKSMTKKMRKALGYTL